MMQKARTHVEAMARKPRMTMTAMAQCGKDDDEAPDWTFGELDAEAAEAAEREEASAADSDDEAAAADDDADAADAVDCIEAITESAKVV